MNKEQRIYHPKDIFKLSDIKKLLIYESIPVDYTKATTYEWAYNGFWQYSIPLYEAIQYKTVYLANFGFEKMTQKELEQIIDRLSCEFDLLASLTAIELAAHCDESFRKLPVVFKSIFECNPPGSREAFILQKGLIESEYTSKDQVKKSQGSTIEIANIENHIWSPIDWFTFVKKV